MNPICLLKIDNSEKPVLIKILNRAKINKDIAACIEEVFDEFVENEEIRLFGFERFTGKCKAELIITIDYEQFPQYGDDYNEDWKLVFLGGIE